MKLRFRPMTPLVLRGVVKRLRKVENEPEPVLSLDQLRSEVRGIVERMAVSYSDGLILAEVNSFLAAKIHEFWRDAQRHHNHTMADLNLLTAQVNAYIAEMHRLNDDVDSRFGHINGAVTHALDRISDPDTPYFDPIPPQAPEGQR